MNISRSLIALVAVCGISWASIATTSAYLMPVEKTVQSKVSPPFLSKAKKKVAKGCAFMDRRQRTCALAHTLEPELARLLIAQMIVETVSKRH
jgi:hypothetical protein